MGRHRGFDGYKLWARDIARETDLPARAKSVAWVLADHVNSDLRCTLLRGTIAKESGLSDRTVGDGINDLSKAGLLKTAKTRGALQFELVLGNDRLASSATPAEHEGVSSATAADQLGNDCRASSATAADRRSFSKGPSLTATANVVRLDSRKPVRHDGKVVPPQRVDLAERVLADFNEQAGTRFSAWTGNGKPSDSLRRIIGALTAWPDRLDFDTCRRTTQATLRSRWWGTGSPSVGVVFGPKVIEQNLARATDSGGQQRSATDRVLRAYGG